MLEYWVSVSGLLSLRFEEVIVRMDCCENHLTKHGIDEKFPTKHAHQRRFYIIPLFHHSIIPWTGRQLKTRINR
jgi:hypothetical protein